MGRRPTLNADGASWLKFSIRLTGPEYIALRNCAAQSNTTMSDLAREAIKGYILGQQLESWHVETAKGVYYPPLTQPGFGSEGEARTVAAQIGGEVIKRQFS